MSPSKGPLVGEIKIDYVEVDRLKPAEFNPRTMLPEAQRRLRKSLEHFGTVDPLVVRRSDGLVIGGHQRLEALKELGQRLAPVVFIEVDDAQAKALNVQLNNPSSQGEWDESSLVSLLAELNIDLPDIEITGFDLEEVGEFLDTLETEELLDDRVDDVPELPHEAVTKAGDLYHLGRHRLLCGDATKREDVARLMSGQPADAVFTDPPYNLDYDFSNNGMVQTGQRKARFGKIMNDSMSPDEYRKFIAGAFGLMLDVMRSGATFYVTGGRTSTRVLNDVLDGLDCHVSQWLIWVKENFNISRFCYHPKHEIITMGWKKGVAHEWHGDRAQVDVVEFAREIGSTVHPTQKPVALITYLLGNSSKRGDCILDLFGGSGSSLIACESIDRMCYVMELDPAYCDVIVRRWENFTGYKAERIIDESR
jgi:DNA modification methylase